MDRKIKPTELQDETHRRWIEATGNLITTQLTGFNTIFGTEVHGDYRVNEARDALRQAAKFLGHLAAGTMPPEWHAAHAQFVAGMQRDYGPDVFTDSEAKPSEPIDGASN